MRAETGCASEAPAQPLASRWRGGNDRAVRRALEAAVGHGETSIIRLLRKYRLLDLYCAH